MRLAALTEDQLNENQRALYRDITTGPRSSGPQHFPLINSAGALNGPFGIMLHAPQLGRPLQELGSAIRYRTGLTARMREIAILAVAAHTDSAFERFAHERVGRAVGLTDTELLALAQGRFTSDNAAETAAYRLCERLNNGRFPLGQDEYAALRESLDEDALLELVVLVGYYRTLSQLMHVFDVGVPAEGAGGHIQSP